MPLLKREPDLFPADLFDLPVEARPWSVAHVRSRQEKALARYLVQKQIPFYLPQTENEIVTKLSSRAPQEARGTSQAGTQELHRADSAATASADRLSPLASAPSSVSSRAPQEARGTSQASTQELHRADSAAAEPADRLSPLALPPSSPHRLSPLAPRLSSRIRHSYNPLFAGYVFLRHTLDERLVVRQSDVIVSLLEVADQRALAGELGQLRDLQAAGASLSPCPWLGPGDAVKITAGAFKGYRGVIVREHGRERLVVSIDLIRQSIAVDFEREMLAPDLFPVHQTRATERARPRSRF